MIGGSPRSPTTRLAEETQTTRRFSVPGSTTAVRLVGLPRWYRLASRAVRHRLPRPTPPLPPRAARCPTPSRNSWRAATTWCASASSVISTIAGSAAESTSALWRAAVSVQQLPPGVIEPRPAAARWKSAALRTSDGTESDASTSCASDSADNVLRRQLLQLGTPRGRREASLGRFCGSQYLRPAHEGPQAREPRMNSPRCAPRAEKAPRRAIRSARHAPACQFGRRVDDSPAADDASSAPAPAGRSRGAGRRPGRARRREAVDRRLPRGRRRGGGGPERGRPPVALAAALGASLDDPSVQGARGAWRRRERPASVVKKSPAHRRLRFPAGDAVAAADADAAAAAAAADSAAAGSRFWPPSPPGDVDPKNAEKLAGLRSTTQRGHAVNEHIRNAKSFRISRPAQVVDVGDVRESVGANYLDLLGHRLAAHGTTTSSRRRGASTRSARRASRASPCNSSAWRRRRRRRIGGANDALVRPAPAGGWRPCAARARRRRRHLGRRRAEANCGGSAGNHYHTFELHASGRAMWMHRACVSTPGRDLPCEATYCSQAGASGSSSLPHFERERAQPER